MKLSGATCLVVFSLLQLLVAFSHCDISAITCNKTVCCASEDGKTGSLCCEKDGCPSTPDLFLENYRRHRRMKNYLEEVCKYYI
uniref:MEG 2.2 n=1 Tax=Schistosoma mansoni TaxID=6183 RepID=D7PD77_SCHMA|nr:MEG 2.2 [Schistosoma mansoni]